MRSSVCGKLRCFVLVDEEVAAVLRARGLRVGAIEGSVRPFPLGARLLVALLVVDVCALTESGVVLGRRPDLARQLKNLAEFLSVLGLPFDAISRLLAASLLQFDHFLHFGQVVGRG